MSGDGNFKGNGSKYPVHIFSLLIIEASLITFLGILPIALAWMALTLASPLIQDHYGLSITFSMPEASQWSILALIQVVGTCIGIILAAKAYFQSLNDGMTIRV